MKVHGRNTKHGLVFVAKYNRTPRVFRKEWTPSVSGVFSRAPKSEAAQVEAWGQKL